MGWLDGRRVLITGGANGIGRAVAERFVAEGAQVAIFDRDADACDRVARKSAGAILAIAGSATSWEDNQRAVLRCVEEFGGLDVLVGNAGVFDFFRALEDFDVIQLDAAFNELFAINVKAYLLGARAAVTALREAGGSVIFTASSASFSAGGGGVLYTASKHAVLGIIRQLACEFAPRVRVNGVAPGGTLTALSGLAATGESDRHLESIPNIGVRIAAASPLHAAMQASDHAGAYVLLATGDQSRAMTGTVIRSDGGLTLRNIG
jgi:NAD(P)-dependent dehydrogenase (short-subunit alcohol dehydrogenase family)